MNRLAVDGGGGDAKCRCARGILFSTAVQSRQLLIIKKIRHFFFIQQIVSCSASDDKTDPRIPIETPFEAARATERGNQADSGNNEAPLIKYQKVLVLLACKMETFRHESNHSLAR